MSAQIRNLREFTTHLRNQNTIDEIIIQLERFQESVTSDYEDEFVDNYVGEAIKLLSAISKNVGEFAQEEIIKKEKT